MNSGTMRIHSKGHFQDGIQVKNEKNRSSLKSLKTENRPEKSKYKPLWGKVFYLDIPSAPVCEKLQKDIKDLGGRVEEFLSKDISYLISNKKEAKFAQTLGRVSPVPSPESVYTAEATSHPSHDGSSFKSPDTVCLSRGKLLVEKAIKDHDFIPSNSILSNALSWGVKILHIDDIRYYIDQKKKELYLFKKSSVSVKDVGKRVCIGSQKTKTGRLKKPFVKVEDINQMYRPFYLQLTIMPCINYSIQKPFSPFDTDKASAVQKKTQVKLRIQTEADKYGGNPVQIHLKEKKRKGYCECCLQKYEDLDSHLLTEQHRNFAQSSHYQVVDDIISKLVFDFMEYERDTPKKKRIKYSVGCVSPVSADVLKKTQLKQKLELQHTSQKDFRDSKVQVTEQSLLHGETQEREEQLLLVPESIHNPSKELRGLDEKMNNQCSMFNRAENDISQNSRELPPHKNIKECFLNISDPKLINTDLEALRVDHYPCTLQTPAQVSVSSMTGRAAEPTQKLETVFSPAKNTKKTHLHSIFNPSSDLRTINSSQEFPTPQAETQSQRPGDEPNECDLKNVDSLPCKIRRKVKILLGRNKKENLEPNAEMDRKRTEYLITQEENICSSPVQSLLDLFQTSEEKSEFLGFTSYPENSAVCDVLDIWDNESSNNLLSMFFSSPSNSTFTGF